MNKRRPFILADPHLWVVVILFIIGIILQYPKQILGIDSPSVFSFIGLSRHAVERIYFLIPIGYANYFLGNKIAWTCVIIAGLAMLPRVFLISEYFADALLETIGVIVLGSLINIWFAGYRQDKTRHLKMLDNLKLAHAELISRSETIEKNEKRLDTINKISSSISQSLELKEILDNAVKNIIDLMKVDAVWIYLLNNDNSELVLTAQEGYPDEYGTIKVGHGISGKVVVSARPLLVEDVSRMTDLPKSVKQQLRSVVVVPLSSKGIVSGTLGVNSRHRRTFDQGEIELLTAIGNQIGVAIENSKLYQKQLEIVEQLRLSEQRYRELFESAQDAIWVHDLDGNIITANKASEELTGYKIEELLGLNVRNYLTEESSILAGQIKRKLLLGEPVEQPYEQRFIRRDKSERLLKLTTNLIRENNEPSGFLHIARDVTREKEIQEELYKAYQELSQSHQQLKESQQQLIQAAKLTSLGQLAASVAHEVNNPLYGVLVYTQLLSKKLKTNGITTETVLEYLSKMESELVRSTKLIRNLLDFARQSPPAFKSIDLNDFVNRAYDLAAHSAELQHIKVVKELADGIPTMTADPEQLQQVFTNLFLNAIQAMPSGGILTIRTSYSGDTVKLEVQDTGCGISKENMSKLFTPFFTTKPEVKGVGLGLAVAYGIVQRHRGRIDVNSAMGKGTTFTIILPLNPEPVPAQQ